MAFAVFDGHGGGSCADMISRRLFHYMALSLVPNLKSYDKNELNSVIEDVFYCPNPYHNITYRYEDRAAEYLKKYLLECEQKKLENFVNDLKPNIDKYKHRLRAQESNDNKEIDFEENTPLGEICEKLKETAKHFVCVQQL